MSFELALLAFVIVAFGFLWLRTKKQLQSTREGSALLTDIAAEQRETLRHGLYQRFKRSDDTEKENPFDFEHFVAELLTVVNESDVYVTKSTGDFGVDIEERRDDGLFLYQVKCYEKPVGFEPIAILHSRIVKDGADGGCVVTTSAFTQAAIDYAKAVDIELIDGDDLLDLWEEALEYKKETARELIPDVV
ncbi:restriction endonuclease [Paenibacillus antri]|uniref:Restriction endonuclease n=1 Tax=Paenibacillus antri TaxID=2582848 RepID=A0A5R9G596_9BACL|nr:restriction endonuclease [Paenibacillus antri]TLS51547.1 restriction endonuclease [Paenibacillus antri]